LDWPFELTVPEIERVTGATPLRKSLEDRAADRTTFCGISIDSRTICKGELFIALRGHRLDGHDFVLEAFQKGAAGALVEKRWRSFVPDLLSYRIWQVDDTLTALGQLARFHRDRFQVDLVAVTGSCGKTTTKAMLAHLIASDRRVLATPGTQNNRIGVPLTLFRMNPQDQVVVLELGTNRWGEIRTLTQMARPTLGVVTNIGLDHLETFGDSRGVLREISALWDVMDPMAPVILNGDDPLLVEAADDMDRPVIWFGLGQRAHLQVDRICLEPRRSLCRVEGRWQMEIPVPGKHNLLNALAALTAACQLGLRLPEAISALRTFTPPPGRSVVLEQDGVIWIDDTYNANPSSFQAGLELLRGMHNPGRKVVVAADMLELGDQADPFHRQAGRWVADLKPDLVIAVGNWASHLLEAAWEAGLPHEAGRSFRESEEAGRFLAQWVRPGDAVWVKGSRAMQMERIFQCFTTSSIH
jgi:UDP-N-acetylmuramoyl-tripeptide--D-alanyl-D-alanine ligase